MKVIHELIACEVSRGVKFTVRESEIAIFRNKALSVIQLPFPCNIIGLASEIDDFQRMLEVMKAANAERGTTWYYFTYINKLSTTPTTDIIFLRKKL